MKHISFKTKTTIWITLLITAVCALSVSGLLIMSRSVSANETRQLLSAAVERNADEIEYKNGILVIESDFDFYSDGVYTDVYNEKLDFIDGEIPVSLADSADFIRNELRTVESGSDKYYVYDKRIDFNRYEYEIDVISGQIIKYEADYSRPEALNASEYSSVHFENGISTLQAIDIALEHAGTSKEDATVIAAELPGYSNRQVFRIEFTCEKPLYGSVWVRGIVPADATAGAFNAIAKTVAYIIPFFILIAAAGAYLISKKAQRELKSRAHGMKLLSLPTPSTLCLKGCSHHLKARNSSPQMPHMSCALPLRLSRRNANLPFQIKRTATTSRRHCSPSMSRRTK